MTTRIAPRLAGCIAAAALVLGTPATADCPDNLLRDPDFEAGDLSEEWGYFASGPLHLMLYRAPETGGEGEASWPVSGGRHALRFFGRMTDDVLSVGQEWVPVEHGRSYEFSFDLLLTSPDVQGSIQVSLMGITYADISLQDVPYTGEYQRITVRLKNIDYYGVGDLAIENPWMAGGSALIDTLCLTLLDEEPPPPPITAVEVQLTINAALGHAIEGGFDPDRNGDGFVNAVDVQLVINAALGILNETPGLPAAG